MPPQSMSTEFRFCPSCATPLALIGQEEDGGFTQRMRCPASGFPHWYNPTPVLAAIVDIDGLILLAPNAPWPGKMFGLITGFMEAGETPEDGIRREIAEETALEVTALQLVGVHDFQRMNQIIITYHARARGEVRLSPELVEYKLLDPSQLKCWRAGTGLALADWLRGRGIEPVFMETLPSDTVQGNPSASH